MEDLKFKRPNTKQARNSRLYRALLKSCSGFKIIYLDPEGNHITLSCIKEEKTLQTIKLTFMPFDVPIFFNCVRVIMLDDENYMIYESLDPISIPAMSVIRPIYEINVEEA